MKYIKQFEKFDSKEITSILSFLKSKNMTNTSSYTQFISDIRHTCDMFDIPMSSLSSIEYLKRSDILELRSDLVNNQYNISHIIFLFDIKNGYLTYGYHHNDKFYVDTRLVRTIDSEYLKSVDFALVLNLDSILLDIYDNDSSHSDIKNIRIDKKSGATSFLDNNTLKDLNIERYFSKLYSKFGINKDLLDLKNLNKLVNDIIGVKSSFMMELYCSSSRLDRLDTFTHNLLSFMEQKLDHNYTYAQGIFLTAKTQTNFFKKYKDFDTSGVFPIFEKLDKKIEKIILSKRIKSISDMYLLARKLEILQTMIYTPSSDYKTSYDLEKYLRNLKRGISSDFNIKNDIIILEKLYDDLEEIF